MNSISKKIATLSVASAVSLVLLVPASPVMAASIEQRLQRLERMVENPVLLQLSRRLGEQQREIQELQDQIDRMQRTNRILKQKSDRRFNETDERIHALEMQAEGGGASEKVANTTPNSASKQALDAVKSTAKTISTGVKAVVQPAGNPPEAEVEAPVVSEKSKPIAAPLEEGTQPEQREIAAPKVASVTTHAATESEKAKYQKAFKLMKASRYDEAIQQFNEFLTSHPESDLASNSAYWAGEGYLIKKEDEKALASFMIVVDRYSRSPKVSDAKLRAGDSLQRLGRIEDAKAMYQELIASRPHSRAAKNATKRLREL